MPGAHLQPHTKHCGSDACLPACIRIAYLIPYPTLYPKPGMPAGRFGPVASDSSFHKCTCVVAGMNIANQLLQPHGSNARLPCTIAIINPPMHYRFAGNELQKATFEGMCNLAFAANLWTDAEAY